MHSQRAKITKSVRPSNHRLPAIYRLRTVRAQTHAVPGRREAALARLEAVLWLADEPMTARKIGAVLGVNSVDHVEELIDQLQSLLAAEDSAFQIEELAGGYQLLTQSRYYPWLVRLGRTSGHDKLTPALMETLAIIAYKQPITRADLEAIRGVHCADALRHLLNRKLIHIAGHHDSLGRPVLYGTTKRFLQMFGLKSLEELPAVDDKTN
jgi:segregation and condensation protein B